MVRVSMEGAVLSHLTKIADAISDEVYVRFLTDGIKVIVIDPSLVSAAYITVDAMALQEYDVPEEIDFGLSVQDLKKFARFVKTKDIVTIEYVPEEGAFKFSVHGIQYMMPILTVDESRKRELNFEYENKISLSAAELAKAIQLTKAVAKSVSPIVKFRLSPEGIIIEARGEGSRSVRFEKTATELPEIDVKETVTGDFIIENLEKIIKAVKESTLVTIKLGNAKPLCLEFDVKGGAGRVTYYQAPAAAEE
ncbi:MAG: hypothetical protein J7J75_04380 [Euryarchaeota archaeon]|nr:hypothetical protein [Euryarchaeota archaeon]MCD6158859.1 hypothetical protein [Euryarchaeota archaeon]